MMLKYVQYLLLVSVTALVLVACQSSTQSFNGYIDADYTYVSPYTGGQLITLLVKKGQIVKKDQLLFTLDSQPQQSQLATIQAQVREALATLKNLQTGERPEELAVIVAQINQAKAQVRYEQKQFVRNKRLAKTDYVAKQELDLVTQNLKVAEENLEQQKK